MSRLWLALLLLVSLWPSPAAASQRAVEPGRVVAANAHYPGEAFRSTGGWELPQVGAAVSSANARGSGGRSPGAKQARPADRSLSFRSTLIARVSDVRLGAGVIFFRFDHLPYYATAPPVSR
ncbi:MAG: hypothetical protein H0X65_23390 [Gemmatimonadetes bacterium]|nr:hypothetical protein [Gemmatimonadota bacterium]